MNADPKTWLVTGVAGFIGMHVALRLIARGDTVVGVDNLNDYYDVTLKHARLARLQSHKNFQFKLLNIADSLCVGALFSEHRLHGVIHLAAQAGVRYSIINPQAYVESNIQGFVNILEGCRRHFIRHLVYASSSSVYGGNTSLPFSEHHNVDHPVSLYAATKKSNELMAHTYSHLFGIPTTGLRFFTVYGPWGRPDMALFLFANAIFAGKPIDIFNHGNMVRDFTFIDDIVDSLVLIADKPPIPNPTFDPLEPDPASSNAPYRILNIGNGKPTPLMDYICALENALNRVAKKNYLPIQPGDVLSTAANTEELEKWIGIRPRTPIGEGVSQFAAWYRDYHRI